MADLAHAIAWDTWRLDHLRAIEMNLYALGDEAAAAADEEEIDTDPDDYDTALTDARTFRSEEKRFDRMSLCKRRLNRNMHLNMTILQNRQAERKRNYERDLKDEILLVRPHEFNDMRIQASARPSKNGFVCSNDEIAPGALLQRYLDTAASVVKTAKPARLYGTTIK
jgi:hypothetical protein